MRIKRIVNSETSKEIIRKYREMDIPLDTLKLVNKELKIQDLIPSDFITSRRLEAVQEAIGWKKGTGQDDRVITKLYSINEYTVAVGKPGKEANPKRERYNENDMNPHILKNGKKITKDLSFWEMFEMIENLKHSNKFSLELLAMLLFRAAFMLDHKKDKDGKLRYCPPEDVMELLESKLKEISGIPIRVFVHFLEVISLNEDIKIYTTKSKYKDLKEDYGRINTLLTFVHIIAVLLERESISNLAGSFSRPPAGMAPIPKTKIEEFFPLFSEQLFSD